MKKLVCGIVAIPFSVGGTLCLVDDMVKVAEAGQPYQLLVSDLHELEQQMRVAAASPGGAGCFDRDLVARCRKGVEALLPEMTFDWDALTSSDGTTVRVPNICTLITEILIIKTKVCEILPKVCQILTKVCEIQNDLGGGCVCTPIKQTDLPLTITTAGVYCVSEPLTYTGTDSAITVNADNVKIDLCKQSLTATATAANGGAILVDGTGCGGAKKVQICNGCIVGGAMSLGSGIVLNFVRDAALRDLVIISHGQSGVRTIDTVRLVINNVTSSSNEEHGILLGEKTTDVDMSDSRAFSNQECGFLAMGTAFDPVERFVWRRNIALGNAQHGFHIGGVAAPGVDTRKGVLLENVAIENGSKGFFAAEFSEDIMMKLNSALCNGAEGFEDDGTSNVFFSNCANRNTPDYETTSGFFSTAFILSPPTMATDPAGYWTNMGP